MRQVCSKPPGIGVEQRGDPFSVWQGLVVAAGRPARGERGLTAQVVGASVTKPSPPTSMPQPLTWRVTSCSAHRNCPRPYSRPLGTLKLPAPKPTRHERPRPKRPPPPWFEMPSCPCGTRLRSSVSPTSESSSSCQRRPAPGQPPVEGPTRPDGWRAVPWIGQDVSWKRRTCIDDIDVNRVAASPAAKT